MAGEPAPVYLLLGPEEGERRAFVEELTKSLRKRDGEVETHRFYAFDSSITEAITLLRSGSLFGGHTLVSVYNAEEIKKKDEIDAFAGYCKAPGESGTLLLISDKPGLDKRVEKAAGGGRKKIFWEMFDNQKQGWLIQYARRKGVRLDPDAAQLVLELVENNKLALAGEIDRLSLFFPEEITSENVETYIYHAKEENVFTLFGALAAGDFEGSLEILEQLLLSSEQHPVQLAAGLLRQFQNLLAIKKGEASHHSPQELFSHLKIRSKRNQAIYATAARVYTLEQAQEILLTLNTLDESLRSTPSILHHGLLRDLVYTITVRRGAPRVAPGAPAPFPR
ncbi:MAG: DNA polymerase III subunit delta [Alkalispirochaetaceae bacterium]